MKTMPLPPLLRQVLVVLLVLATFAGFWWYLAAHPQYVSKLTSTPLHVVVLLWLVNLVLVGVLSVINYLSVKMCGVRMKGRETWLLTAYSTLANFFGPLQSGPGVRAVYLKKKYHIRIASYTMATLVCYGVFALWSALFLMVGTRPWWQTVLCVAATAAVVAAVLRGFMRRSGKAGDSGRPSGFSFAPRMLILLGTVTFLQVTGVAIRYAIELNAVGSHASIGQAVSYAGASNFALFVSVTPDGIGIRETFLLLSQHIHGVPAADIVTANLLDRASYVAFLGILFVVVMAFHAHERFGPGRQKQSESEGRS